MSQLPKGWEEGTLVELAGPNGLVTDGDWVESKDQDPNGVIRLTQLADIGDGKFLNKSARFLNAETAERLRCTFLEEGDLLVARMPDPLGRACIFPGVGQPAVTAVDVFIWRPDDFGAHSRWLMHFINSPEVRAAIQSEAGGTTRQRVAGGKLKQLRLPVPPLAEQRRIVTKLDTVRGATERARVELDRIPALIDRYKQAILSAAFYGELTGEWRKTHYEEAEEFLDSCSICTLDTDDLPSLPRGWSWVAAGQLCNIKTGIALGKKRPPEATLIERPYLRVANVQRGWLDLEEIKTLRVTQKEAESLYLQRGDVLMNEGGDRDKLGRGWVWEGQVDNSIHQNHVFRLRPRSPRIPSRYISYYSNEFGQSYFLRSGKQTTNLASISLSKVSALPIPVAPPREMERIVQLIETAFGWLDRVAAEHENATRLLPRLDQAILAKAYRGELVPQHPNDEPASRLLERVRATGADSPKRGRRVRLRGAGSIQITGTGTLTVAQKEQNVNKTRKDVPPGHLCDIVKNSGGEIESAALWRASEMQIDEFYKLLRDDVAANRLKESEDKASIINAN
jgi:type I restriction enzyme, S subunit